MLALKTFIPSCKVPFLHEKYEMTEAGIQSETPEFCCFMTCVVVHTDLCVSFLCTVY